MLGCRVFHDGDAVVYGCCLDWQGFVVMSLYKSSDHIRKSVVRSSSSRPDLRILNFRVDVIGAESKYQYTCIMSR